MVSRISEIWLKRNGGKGSIRQRVAATGSVSRLLENINTEAPPRRHAASDTSRGVREAQLKIASEKCLSVINLCHKLAHGRFAYNEE